MKIAVLSNCTHRGVAKTLQKNLPDAQVVSYPVFALDAAAREKVLDDLSEMDRIFTLEHTEKFAPLDTKSLRARFKERVYSCPTPFFCGQQPDMAYLLEGNNIFVSRVELLGDYNSGLLLSMVQDGIPQETIVADYVSGAAFELIDIPGLWNASLQRLRDVENRTEISISGAISELARHKQVFLSFNHPTEDLICEISEQFARKALGSNISFEPISPADHDLYADAFWPVRPQVQDAMGLTFHAEQEFKRPDRMGGEMLTIEDFARASCDFYYSHPNLQKLNVVTPDYLKNYLGH